MDKITRALERCEQVARKGSETDIALVRIAKVARGLVSEELNLKAEQSPAEAMSDIIRIRAELKQAYLDLGKIQ